MQHFKTLIFMIAICTLPLQGIWYDVCIDPGHCGDADPGAYGVNGSAEPNESDFNLDIALVCYDDLVYTLGWSVILTRHDEHYMPKLNPGHKAEIANGERKNDYGQWTDYPVSRAVSIHNNSSTNPSARGTETYYSPANWLSQEFATSVHNGAWNYLQMFPYAQNRGVKSCFFSFIRNCHMPACLIEVAFVSHNPSGGQWEQLLYNSGGIKDYAAYGIDDGITGLWFLRPPPGNLRLVWEPGLRGVTIVWHPTTAPSVTYSIYRREHPNPDFILIGSGITDTTYTDNSTTNNRTYSYYVIAVSGSQNSPRSNLLTVHTPPFSSDYSLATAFQNGKKIVFDNSGLTDLVYSSDTSAWFTRSTDYGLNWLTSHCLEIGQFPAIALDVAGNPHIVDIGIPGLPDTASGEDTSFVIFYSQHLTNSGWKSPTLYETYDSILSVSFAIDPLDTGWVVFNTYDDEGNNELKIGQFYTQTLPESLENVTTLDTYNSYGKAAVVVRPSDRNIWIVYERNNTIMCKWRQSNGNWWTILIQQEGIYPCLSISTSGDLIHFIWEKYYSETDRREIQTIYTNGLFWPRVQTIAAVRGENCYPYIEKGSVAVWADLYINQWEVYSSQRTESGNWTTPQNISQTLTDSKYPQVAMYQTVSQTNLVYVWTEGNESPYEVKILPVSLRSNPVPLYAFNLGKKEPSVFLKQRSGYVVYEESFEKSADYDTSFLHYKITGLDPDKIYHLGLVFYQDETDGVWKQNIEIDNCLIKKINLPRKKTINEKIVLSQEDYQDGIIELKIKKLSGPKVVLGAMSVWEFSKEDHPVPFAKESSMNVPQEFNVLTLSNPVKDKSLFHYQLPKACQITIKIYSISGQLVREIKENKPAGLHTTIWDGKDTRGIDVASGIYFYRVESTNKTKTDKIIFLR